MLLLTSNTLDSLTSLNLRTTCHPCQSVQCFIKINYFFMRFYFYRESCSNIYVDMFSTNNYLTNSRNIIFFSRYFKLGFFLSTGPVKVLKSRSLVRDSLFSIASKKSFKNSVSKLKSEELNTTFTKIFLH